MGKKITSQKGILANTPGYCHEHQLSLMQDMVLLKQAQTNSISHIPCNPHYPSLNNSIDAVLIDSFVMVVQSDNLN